MSKLTTNTINSRYGSTEALNNNFSLIEEALENTLSRDGTGPNYMEANLDMNSNAIVNASTVYASGLVLDGVPVETSSSLVRTSFATFSFTATAAQTTFSVSPYVLTPTGVRVTVNGLQLPPADISTSGTSVVIPACTANDEVVVEVYTRELSPVATLNTYSFTATASQTSFTVGSEALVEGSVMCAVNGLTLPPSDLSINNNIVTIPARSLNDEVVFYVYTREVGAAPSTTASVVSYTQEGGAVPSNVKAKLDHLIYVTDFGADPSAATDSTVAIQAAITYAQSLASTHKGACVFFPAGEYLVSDELSITSSNIVLMGVGPYSSVIRNNTNGINVINFAGTSGLLHVGVQNLGMRSSIDLTSGTFIRMFNVSNSIISNVVLQRWYEGIDLIGCARVYIDKAYLTARSRGTSAANYGIRLRGDATAGRCSGIHISDLEINSNKDSGYSGSPWTYGIYVQDVDGLYLQNSHFIDGDNLLIFWPNNTTNNNTISAVRVVNCYFDRCLAYNVWMRGNATTSSFENKYGDISFVNCLFRAADFNLIQIIPDTTSIKGLSFVGCQFRQGQDAGIIFANDLIDGVTISSCVFEDNNRADNVNGHDVLVRGNNVKLIGNLFMNVSSDAFTATANCIFVASSATKTTLENNNMASSRRTVKLVNNATAKSGFRQIGNVYSNAGSFVDEMMEITTTSTSPTTLWSYTLAASESAHIEFEVTGVDATTSTITHVVKRGTYYRNGSSSAALLGTNTTVREQETPAGYAVDFNLTGNTVAVQVTAPSASSVTWVGRIKAVLR